LPAQRRECCDERSPRARTASTSQASLEKPTTLL
jgi:hypothetical protein